MTNPINVSISSTATGSFNPRDREVPRLPNGDFIITPFSNNPILGDGRNENTDWVLDFSGDSNLGLFPKNGTLTSAILTLSVRPGHNQVSTDDLFISSLPEIPLVGIPGFPRNFPVGETNTLTINLLNYYTSDQILGAFNGSGSTGVVNYGPNQIAFRYYDDAIISRANLTLHAVNHPPVANPDTATTDEDNSVTINTINLLANDIEPDNGTLSFKEIDDSATTGSVSIDGNNIIYDPNGQFDFLKPGETATDVFQYTILDDTNLEGEGEVTVTITGVNDNPILDINNGLMVDEDAIANITATELKVTDVDNSAEEIIYTITDAPDNGNLLLNGNPLAIDDEFTQDDIDNNRLSYDHDGSETTSDSFDFTVDDSAGGTIGSEETFDIKVNPVNDPPVANDDTATTRENNKVIIDVLANDTDPEVDTLTIIEIDDRNTKGSVTIDGDNIIYNPNKQFDSLVAGETDIDSFTYTIDDGNSLTDTATVNITINGVKNEVDTELSLLVDISESVDNQEYKTQIEGYIAAFNNENLFNNFIDEGLEGQVAVNLIVWAGEDQIQEVVGWTLIDSVETSQDFATAIGNALLPENGGSRPFDGATAPGDAINFAVPLFSSNVYEGRHWKIDLSADGKQNDGINPATARDNALAAGVDVINAIVVSDDNTVVDFYRDNVIGGDDAFVSQTNDFTGFEQGIYDKLTTELTPLPLLSIADFSLQEGDNGTTNFVFDVTLSKTSTEDITVDFTTADGTAVAGKDYTATNDTLTFAAGETTKQITVSVTGENRLEIDENFFVNLSNATNAEISDTQAQVTILNDDEILLNSDNVDENSPEGTVVGLLSATDSGDTEDPFSFKLINDAGGRFKLVGNELQVANGNLLDFETNESHTIEVQASDSNYGFDELDSQTFTININDVNESPSFLPIITIPENSPEGTPVTQVSATDPENDTLTYAIVSGNADPDGDGNNAFAIDSATGEITVADSGDLDFETTPTFNLNLTVTDEDGLSDNTSITIGLIDVDESQIPLPPVPPVVPTPINPPIITPPIINPPIIDPIFPIQNNEETTVEEDSNEETVAENNDSETTSTPIQVENNAPIVDDAIFSVDEGIFALNTVDNNNLKFTVDNVGTSNINEVGLFIVDDENGNINGIAPDSADYLQAALERAQVIFSAISDIPSGFQLEDIERVLEIESDTRLGFYMISNASTDEVLTELELTGTTNSPVFFSNSSNMRVADLDTESFTLEWSEQALNDEFTDVVLSAELTEQQPALGTKLQRETQQELIDLSEVTDSVSVVVEVHREAAQDNVIGFYEITDINGGIDTDGDGVADINPGDAGYKQAALTNRITGLDLLTTENQQTTSFNGTFDGDSILAPFMIVDGTLDEALNDSTEVFFSFLGANSDGVDHVRLLGDNIFGFEDLLSGGDFDFNDVIVEIDILAG